MSTPEGDLIRFARESAVPSLTQRQAATKLSDAFPEGLSAEQWGTIERGHTRARPGQPARLFTAPPRTVARMAATVGVTPEQLENLGQDRHLQAAAFLRQIQGRPASEDADKLIGELFTALAAARPSPDVIATLPRFWDLQDGQGGKRTMADRVSIIIQFVTSGQQAGELRVG